MTNIIFMIDLVLLQLSLFSIEPVHEIKCILYKFYLLIYVDLNTISVIDAIVDW